MTIIFLIHLIGEETYYRNFSEGFSASLDSFNYLLLSLLATKILVLLLMFDLLKKRVFNLINYFPYLFLFNGAFNSFNLNFFKILLVLFGIEAIFLGNDIKNLLFHIFLSSVIFISKYYLINQKM